MSLRERESFVVLMCTMIALVAPKLLREREREGERCEKLGGRKKKAQVICLTKRHI
jgi:hypothetical protein